MFSRQRILHATPYLTDNLNIETLVRAQRKNAKVEIKLSPCGDSQFEYINKAHAGDYEYNRIIIEELDYAGANGNKSIQKAY